jgi:hypothetical protein
MNFEWDVSWDADTSTEVILVDIGDETIYLTAEELREMLEALGWEP